MSNTSQNFKIRQVTPHPSINNPLNKPDSTTPLTLTKHKSLLPKSSFNIVGRSKSKLRNKEIHEENCRLTTKIIQIKQRKARKQKIYPVMTSNKMQNPERIKEISLENQRLGRSLVMIKSGKTIERIKTQIAQQILKLAETSCSRRLTTSQSQSSNLLLECNLPSLARSNNSTLSDSWNKSIDVDSIMRRKRKKQGL